MGNVFERYFADSFTTGSLTATSIRHSGLTATRIVYAGSGGALVGDSGLIYNAGNVRIGTSVTSPAQRLFIVEDSADYAQLITQANALGGGIQIIHSSDGSGVYMLSLQSDGGSTIGLRVETDATVSTGGNLEFLNNTDIGPNSNTPRYIYVGSALDVPYISNGSIATEILKFTNTTSAVNEITIKNNITGNAPEVQGTGNDTNVDVKITPKGSGAVVVNATSATASTITHGLTGNNTQGSATADDLTWKTTSSATAFVVDASADEVKNSVKYVSVPSAAQAITAVGNTILANAEYIELNPDANYTLTSAPTIADGTTGQHIYITCADGEANTVIVQDEDTLSSSNLHLGATTRTIGARDVLHLMFNGSSWIEVSYADN